MPAEQRSSASEGDAPERLTIFERADETFENYISGPLRGHFLRHEFLVGLAERHKDLNDRLAKQAGILIILTTLTAFFDSISGNIKFLGIEFKPSENLTYPLSIVVGAGLLAVIQTLIDSLLVQRYIYKLGSS